MFTSIHSSITFELIADCSWHNRAHTHGMAVKYSWLWSALAPNTWASALAHVVKSKCVSLCYKYALMSKQLKKLSDSLYIILENMYSVIYIIFPEINLCHRVFFPFQITTKTIKSAAPNRFKPKCQRNQNTDHYTVPNLLIKSLNFDIFFFDVLTNRWNCTTYLSFCFAVSLPLMRF